MKITAGRIRSAIEHRWYFHRISSAFRGKTGLEIGGPSQDFSPGKTNYLFPPVYTLARSIDNCNFATTTVWSEASADRAFEYLSGRIPGRQYIDDATRLESIAPRTYDFLLASHVLEHVANPLKALSAWHRVLKPGGWLLILLPSKAHTFDHRRPSTTFAHLREDLERETQEDDLTHLPEIFALHDLEQDKAAGTRDQFQERSLRNVENRCLHHHVFSPEVVGEMLRSTGFAPLYISTDLPPHILGFARARG